MTRPAKLLLSMVACLAAGGMAAPFAAAQCRLCDSPTTAQGSADDGKPLALQIETSLDFDQIIVLGSGEGSAVLRPDGSRTVSGIVGEMSGRAMVGAAVIRGEPNRAVRVDLPGFIRLHSMSGGEIHFDELVSDLPADPRLDAAGNLVFRFGGRLRVQGDSEGDFRGEVPITVEYP